MESMHRFFLFLACFVGLFVTSSTLAIPGVPDSRELSVKISRGSGTSYVSFGYAVVVILALALFVVMMRYIICYKDDLYLCRNCVGDKKVRGEEKTIFLTRF